MAARQPGPFKQVPLGNGQNAPLYLVEFDKDGRVENPLTRQHLIDAVKNGTFSDLYILSHGWNNTFDDAMRLYDELLTGYLNDRQSVGLNDAAYRPVYVGVIWPSTALVFPWENGPDMAAFGVGAGAALDADAAGRRAEREIIAPQLRDEDVPRFYELAERETLSKAEALDLARILQPIFALRDPDSAADDPAPTPEELIELWGLVPPLPDEVTVAPPQHGFAGDEPPAPAEAAANILKWLDPRRAIRIATVLSMKDRAGTVGSRGVGPLLVDLLAASATARVHLVGHSYGGRVVLSAVSFPDALPRKVNSVLLLQPATSYLCFSKDVERQGRAGGYRKAFERSEAPIFTTFSPHDRPLTKVFHLAVRRSSDLGDLTIAAAGTAPNKFAALGGFGPGDVAAEMREVRMAPKPFKYPAPAANVRVYALDGTDGISGHSDVRNAFTWWALINQVAGDRLP